MHLVDAIRGQNQAKTPSNAIIFGFSRRFNFAPPEPLKRLRSAVKSNSHNNLRLRIDVLWLLM